MSTPVFYDSLQSSAAWRVRIALALKEIAHETVMLEIIGKPHRTPEFLALNPQGTVPVLKIDGHAVPQSLTIMEYLEDTRPTPRLLPRNPAARARVRLLSHVIAMETHAVTNMDVALDASGGDSDRLTDWMHRYVRRGFDAFEAHIDHPATGRFCQGDAPTMADCCMVPQARNAARVGLDLTTWPKIATVYAACLELPAFADTHPDKVAPLQQTQGVNP